MFKAEGRGRETGEVEADRRVCGLYSMAGTNNAEMEGWELRQRKGNHRSQRAEEFGLYPEVNGKLPRGYRQGKDVLDVHSDHYSGCNVKNKLHGSRGNETCRKSIEKI